MHIRARDTKTVRSVRTRDPVVDYGIPTFIEWVKYMWLDIFTMGFVGAVGIGIFFLDPAFVRSFAVTNVDDSIMFPDLAYPYRRLIIPIWLSAFLAPAVPIIIFLLMQFRIKSFWDLNNAILGMLYALITGSVFHVFVKWIVGGLRPHFLSVCQPVPGLAADRGIAMPGYTAGGFLNTFFTPEICTGNAADVKNALQSFPSGHTTAAFATLGFLYLYLNGKLKVYANYHPSYWKMIALYLPILGATVIAGTLTIDVYHNWYDIIAGGVIGMVMALSAYRMTYASVWDWRFNHIPLSRVAPFTYSGPPVMIDQGFADSTWTKKAGWGNKSVMEGRMVRELPDGAGGAGPRFGPAPGPGPGARPGGESAV